jgi:multidrug resistance protein, MATE family
LVALAVPVALGELGWIAMSVVDIWMVGKLGASAIAAVGLASALYYPVGIVGMSLLAGMDTRIAQAVGARDLPSVHRNYWQALWLAIALLLPLGLLYFPLDAGLRWQISDPALANETLVYLRVLLLGTPALFLYSHGRRYLQAKGSVKPFAYAIISANLINLFFNQALIFGSWGFPQLGTEGSAWATTIARIYEGLFLLGAVWWHERKQSPAVWSAKTGPQWSEMGALLKLGAPAAAQVGLEIGIFGLATLMIGGFGTVMTAAHQIALNIASVTYMVPLGISSAAAVAVGHAVGAKNQRAAITSGWMAIGLAAGFMSLMAVLFFLAPRWIMRIYTFDPAVIEIGAKLLWIAAFFQLFDGIQISATGVLRGWGDTRTPMLVNLLGHWLVGLPICYVLGFLYRWQAEGIWYGLAIGLLVVAIALLWTWHQTYRKQVEAKDLAAA